MNIKLIGPVAAADMAPLFNCYAPPKWYVAYERNGEAVKEGTPHASAKDAQSRATWLLVNGVADPGTARVRKETP